jgi:hypothetical protein
MSFMQPHVRAARADRKHKREKKQLDRALERAKAAEKERPVQYRGIKETCGVCGWTTTRVVKATDQNFRCRCGNHVAIGKSRRVSLPKRIMRFLRSMGVPLPDRAKRSQ